MNFPKKNWTERTENSPSGDLLGCGPKICRTRFPPLYIYLLQRLMGVMVQNYRGKVTKEKQKERKK